MGEELLLEERFVSRFAQSRENTRVGDIHHRGYGAVE